MKKNWLETALFGKPQGPILQFTIFFFENSIYTLPKYTNIIFVQPNFLRLMVFLLGAFYDGF